jgi:hypothetical protein
MKKTKEELTTTLKTMELAIKAALYHIEQDDYAAAFSAFVFKQNDIMDSINHSGSMSLACLKVREEIFHAITQPRQES